MSIKSKAAMALEKGTRIEVDLIDVDPPKAGEVLIEVKAAGLCHSDLHAATGHIQFNAGFPGLLGHEGAGVVLETGPGVTRVRPGDHVVPFVPECGECAMCRSAKTNQCIASFVDAGQDSRYSYRGRRLHPFMGLGLFSQYAVLREHSLVPVRKDAPFERLFYFGCGATTGLGSALFRAEVEPGSSVIVFGLGGIGLNVVQGARLAGAARIIAVDTNPAKADVARRLGATDFVDPAAIDGDVVPLLIDMTGGGADFTFEAVGNVKLMRQAFEAAHFAYGTCTIIGLSPADDLLSIAPIGLVMGRRLQGAPMGGASGLQHIPRLIDWMMDGKIIMDPLITGHMPIERINEGYEMQGRGEGIRTYVTF
ncbi:alcohol dehydrogenase catalytic domain-containing protein [Sphingobium sp. Sx8-8]|uniref:alcohol dehydrogenase catalytic domain-containing protein n=1 Tax=Sphingobium sp. Sx8-8 TaxID=2933617 RepID=UPI001F5AC8C7|nr:alcohol dehydrogenase catalytic domain-containing protein [Sphingobium sp. Sx8-8]